MIIIIAYYPFPDGSAGSERLKSLAKAVRLAGYNDILVIAKGNKKKTYGNIESIPYVTFGSTSKTLNYLQFGFNAIKEINQLRKNTTIEAIILGTCNLTTDIVIRRFSHSNKIPLIKDVVEWYSACQFRLRWFSISYIEKEISNRFIIGKKDRVIAISRYLFDYFSNKGIKCVRIPIFFNQAEYQFNDRPPIKRNYIQIIYAGSPGKKDYIHILLEAVNLLPIDIVKNQNIKICLLGVSQKYVRSYCSSHNINFDFICNVIDALGRVSRSVVLEKYRDSDFSILIRDGAKRYAKAGFPSKIIESISMGIPPITNFTSDIDLYFENRRTCIEIADCTPAACKDSLLLALSMSSTEIENLKKQAKNLAMTNFDISSYKNELKNIIQS